MIVKLFIITILVCACILGCNDIPSNISNSPKDAVSIKNNVIKDNIKVGYSDGFINVEQNKVIGDMKFGMSKNEVDKIITTFKRAGKYGYGFYIGEYKYNKIYGCYLNDSLHSLIVESSGKHIIGDKLLDVMYESVDDKIGPTIADEQFADLSALLESKYGEPSERTRMERKWLIGRKTVVLALTKYDNSGHVFLEISLPNVVNRAGEKWVNESKRATDSIAKSVFK